MAKAVKKTAAENFFAGAQQPTTNNTHTQQTQTINNGGFALGQPQREIKSKRVNLVLQPSLYEKAQAVAAANGISFNEMVTQLLRQITETE